MADEVKEPTQEEKDAVLYDLVMARRKVTHLGAGVYVNAVGRKVNADGSEPAQTAPSKAPVDTVFTDGSGRKYVLQNGALMEVQEQPSLSKSISTPSVASASTTSDAAPLVFQTEKKSAPKKKVSAPKRRSK